MAHLHAMLTVSLAVAQLRLTWFRQAALLGSAMFPSLTGSVGKTRCANGLWLHVSTGLAYKDCKASGRRRAFAR